MWNSISSLYVDTLNEQVECLGAAVRVSVRTKEAIPFPKQTAASVRKENTNEMDFLCV